MASSNPWSSGLSKKTPYGLWSDPEVLSLHVLPDSRTVVVITRAGDITTVTLDEDQPTVRPWHRERVLHTLTEAYQADVVGSVEGGIMSAAWSPDDTLLVLVTGQLCFPDTPDHGGFGTGRYAVPDAYKRVRNPAVSKVNNSIP